MTIRQISVFLENRSGYLAKVLSTLALNNIDIKALSVSDTTEYGILRMIVSNPEEAYMVLKDNGFSANLNKVLCFETHQNIGSFAEVAACFAQENLSIEYLYAFSLNNKAVMITRTKDSEKALDIIAKHNLRLITEDELKG